MIRKIEEEARKERTHQRKRERKQASGYPGICNATAWRVGETDRGRATHTRLYKSLAERSLSEAPRTNPPLTWSAAKGRGRGYLLEAQQDTKKGITAEK